MMIFENPSVTIEEEKPFIKRWLNINFLSFAIAFLAILAFLIYSFVPTSKVSTNSKTAKTTKSSISLAALNSNFKLSENIPVSIKINTGLHSVDGVDIELSYDPEVLEATSSGITPTALFPEYPLAEVSPLEGKIRISANTEIGQSYMGVGTLATINFKPKKPGSTEIKLIFTPGNTTDSNMVNTQSGEDLLVEVNNLKVVIE